MVRAFIIIVISIYALAILAVIIAPGRPRTPATRPATTQASTQAATRAVDDATDAIADPAADADSTHHAHELPQMVGMGLNLYQADDVQRYLDAVDQIADMGFNTLHAVTPVFEENAAAEKIERLVGPGRGTVA